MADEVKENNSTKVKSRKRVENCDEWEKNVWERKIVAKIVISLPIYSDVCNNRENILGLQIRRNKILPKAVISFVLSAECKPEIVAMDVKAPKMRFYRKRCDEACPNYKPKSESVKIVEEERKGKRRKNRLWRETCIETCPNYKAKTTNRGEKRKHSALKEEVMDIEAIVQQLSV
ncbi:uncharacterized protein [Periplaneta americana]|uniref:uncharacterized protein n=1 Tax=Periplaneta americana TaxID=6978 RepID=UPI0037E853CD